jgi:hypothetical protein
MSPETSECRCDHTHDREAAYRAVYTVIEALPGSVHRNATIWRAVEAALDAAGVIAHA